MHAVCPFQLIVGAVVILLGGCASPLNVAYDVIDLGNEVGLRRPYENVRVYSIDREGLYDAVLRVLDLRGSQVLAADKASGIVSWVDIGASFIPISSSVEHDRPARESRLAPSLLSWRGVVYGAARIKPFKEQTWLLLKSAGRDRTTGRVSFSEGTYERSLLNEVAREVQRSRPRDKTARAQSAAPPLVDPKGTSYSQLYTKHFLNTPEPERGALKSLGRKEVFPADTEEVWAACVDVIAQFDTVIQVSPRDRRAVFAHSIAIPARATQGETTGVATDVNVIFSLHVERRGTDGTTVTLAFLAPDGLALRPIVNLSRKDEAASLKDSAVSSTEIAAALVAEEFFGKLTTQVFYEERWQKRLSRRSTAGS